MITSYQNSTSVADAYNRWTEDALLERLWGDHVHLGFYGDPARGRDFRLAKDDFVHELVRWSGIDRLPAGVDASGENGEFHTFVYEGPNFLNPVAWKSVGKKTYISPPEYGSQTYYFDELDVLSDSEF